MTALCLLSSAAWARQKTDIVVLTNGDRITCEIKQLDRGILKAGTDGIGTINIEWDDVDSLSSVYQFRVEDHYGIKHFGAIFLMKDGTLEVIQGENVHHVQQVDVVEITPMESSFWAQLDGSINLGFSYTKSNDLAQLSTDINVRRRTRVRSLELDISSITTWQQAEDTQRRSDLSLTLNRLLAGPWYTTTSIASQTNDELGLDLRVQLSAGLGLKVAQSNHNDLVTSAGLSGNREWSGDREGEYNLEAFASVEHAVFRYDYPKTDITSEITVYPNLTTWGRVRSEVDISASREVVKDFTLVLSFYDSYDSDPADENAQKNDYGLVFSLGWTF